MKQEPRRHHHRHRDNRAGRGNRRRRPGAGPDPPVRQGPPGPVGRDLQRRGPRTGRLVAGTGGFPGGVGRSGGQPPEGNRLLHRRDEGHRPRRDRPADLPDAPGPDHVGPGDRDRRPGQRQANLTKSEANRDALLDAYKRDRSSPGASHPAAGRRPTRRRTTWPSRTAKVQEAAIAQAKAGVRQAQANLKEARPTSTTARSRRPVNGVIVDRRVNVGQTVVASLSAPASSCWPRT